jgi:hypothetical protein
MGVISLLAINKARDARACPPVLRPKRMDNHGGLSTYSYSGQSQIGEAPCLI